MNPAALQQTLSRSGLAPSKHLGQNFLINEGALEKIIHFANVTKDDTIVEIGPGLGIVTERLAAKAKRVIAVEIDVGFVRFLRNRFASAPNVEIVQGDILEFDPRFNEPYRVVGNIPYQISSLIIEKFLQKTEKKPLSFLVTVQKEFADRLMTLAPRANRLSLLAHYYSTPKILAHFPPNFFWPPPKVNSILLSLDPLPMPRLLSRANETRMWQAIKKAFNQPRKMLKNTLPELAPEKFAIKRPQEVSLEEWVEVYTK